MVELDLGYVKLLLVGGMFLVGLIPGVLPVVVPLWCWKTKHDDSEESASDRSKQRHRNPNQMHLSKTGEKVVATLACFGAGVFLGTFFFGMLGEVRSAWEEWFAAAGITSTYCWAEVFATIGFLMVMFVEQIVVFLHSIRKRHKKPPGTGKNRLQQLTSTSADDNLITPVDAPDEEPPAATTNLKTVLRSIILLLALSLHAFFEGMAIGLPKDPRKTLTLFASICVHDVVESFCFGINISQSTGLAPLLKIVFVVAYACMAPMGIAVGLAISHAPESFTRFAIVAILQGLASGTFLYVIFIEILPKQLLSDDDAADGHDNHDHDNIFLEDMHQNSINHNGEKHHKRDGVENGHEIRRRSSHLSAASATTATPTMLGKAVKLMKCTVFALGIAVMGLVTFMLP